MQHMIPSSTSGSDICMRKSNFIFLLFFFLFMFTPVPVYFLFREQIGYKNTENKAAEEFPGLDRTNYSTWHRRFEEWLSDNLPFKTQFIELFRGFQYLAGLDYTQSDVIRGDDGFLFYRKTIDNYKGITRFTDEELSEIENNLSYFFSEMETKGIRCLLYIAPDKEQIYPEKMPGNIRRVSETSRGDQLTEYLKEHTSFPVLYPKDELRNISRKIPVYFSTDTHWNFLGGWAAAQQIRSAFSGTEEVFHEPRYFRYNEKGKDLAGMLCLEDLLPEVNAADVEFQNGLTINKVKTENYGKIQRFTTAGQADERNKKLMIIGDSFSEYYLHSAGHDVKDIVFITYGNMYLIDIETEKPDYLVVMLVERNLPFLLLEF